MVVASVEGHLSVTLPENTTKETAPHIIICRWDETISELAYFTLPEWIENIFLQFFATEHIFDQGPNDQEQA